MDKKFSIKFNNGSFERQDQIKNFSFKSKKFSGLINQMNDKVDELDRFDDFDKLKIGASFYENKGGEYGIVKTRDHGRDVIYDYQLEAAKDFLKELRGFGLLADTVGSGKTFEACVVLSELAQRNKIRSLLFIVPKQVISDWIKTVEKYFGLGNGVLLHIKNDDPSRKVIFLNDNELNVETIGGYKVPRRPIIVSDEDFSKLDSTITNYLFDCIVVDEAHHLCDEKDVYSRTMNRISQMIQIKKKAQRPYCLLLSATPHSGNLEHMFKLWYFIRCTGGNPDDFINDNKTDEYNMEKEYYLNIVCRKAKTVMQFIEIVKKHEVETKYRDKYFEYVRNNYSDYNEYNSLPDGKKNEMVSNFLNLPENEAIHLDVTKNVASAYHNGVLRTIMIRNPESIKNSSEKKRIEKNIVNYLFFPTRKDYPNTIIINNKDSVNRGLEVNVDKLDTDKAIKFDNHYYSLTKYCKEQTADSKYSSFYAALVRDILSTIDNVDDDLSENNLFEKKHSFRYYQQRMRECESRVDNRIIVQKYKEGDIFTDKYEVTKKILEENSNQRIIIFFDYDAKRNKDDNDEINVILKFIKEIKNSKFKDRIIIGRVKSEDDKKEIEDKFNEKEDAILIVADEALTEGTNLQTSSIIINFEITPNPVALDQRIGRIYRLGQKNDVTIYSLAHMNILEGYSLMYFTSIGLLTSNSGDATIIAGSNSENMVAVRCTCGNVKLMSQDDYDYNKKHDLLYCDDPICVSTRAKNQRLMSEISIENYKCDICGEALVRSNQDDLYRCLSTAGYSNTSKCMVSLNEGKEFSCQKICAMGNCEKFKDAERRGHMCPVLGAYKDNKYISPAKLMIICARCNRDDCPEECRYSSGINKCKNCSNATCRPRPHVISFNPKHEAKCPNCKDGYLRPVAAATFGAYVRKAWDFKNDNGASFCDNLEKEAEKVAEIKRILDCDGKGDK